MRQTLAYLMLFALLFLAPTLSAQKDKAIDVSAGLQVYPTGFIPGIHIEWGLNQKSALVTRVGYNVVRHRDLGEHEDERGGGFGFTLGYRRYFKDVKEGFSLALKSDLWFNDVDWKDFIDEPNEVSGQTDVTVLQPTLEAAYFIKLGTNNWFFVPSLALGAEINIRTVGAEVGQGAILLAGVRLGKRF